MDWSEYYNNIQPPAIMGGAGLAPVLAGGQRAGDAKGIIAYAQVLLLDQEKRYGHGEQPPVLVQQHPYNGPPLRYVMTGRQVKFCTTKEEVLYHYQTVPEGKYWPVPEYAARLQGANGAGIVRARVNKTGHAPSAIPAAVADRLGLRRHPLRTGGVIHTIRYQGIPSPAEVLDEPLTVQLLAGPDTVALEVTLPAVLVLPTDSESNHQLFELQLGMFDFCTAVELDWLPLWASQFTNKRSGYCCALPVVAPQPPHIHKRLGGTSTFHITQEAYEEVLEIALARQAVLARRTAAAAAAAGANDAPSPAEAAAEAMLQTRRIEAGSAPAPPPPAATASTREWIDEWAPTPTQQHGQQHRQRGRSSRRGGRHGRGRGSGRANRSQQQAAHASSTAESHAAGPAATHVGAEAGDAAGFAATATTGIYAELDPLPEDLAACLWREVAATSLPEGDDNCIICMDTFTDDLEDGSVRLVTQLHCRHTHCVLCLRQYITTCNFKRRPLRCPHCNTEV